MAAKPKRAAGDDGVLPPELVTEVLHRLPVKLILRCRSVCKSWYALISSPNFISGHLVKNPKKNGVLLHFHNNYHKNGCISSLAWPFSSHGGSFVETLDHDDIPWQFHGSRAGIVGSCNGLICLFRFNPPWGRCNQENVIIFLIWNPSIRKAIELPSRGFEYGAPRFFSYFGFGFDSNTGDYKVMCIHSASLGTADANVCEIYDLSKGVWRSISPLVPLWWVRSSSPECSLHGAVHWTGCVNENDESFRILLSFGFSDEVFTEIRIPDHVCDGLTETRSVTFGGLIHVIVWKTMKGRDRVDASEGNCSIWAMKEYGVAESWCKLFNIDVRSTQLNYGDVFPEKFRFCENGEILMVHDVLGDELEFLDRSNSGNTTTVQGLVLYNTESRKCESILPLADCISDLCLYEESLVLL